MSENEPERAVACDKKKNIRTQSKNKRKYGPREHWWDANIKLAYEMLPSEYKIAYVESELVNNYIKNNEEQHLAVANWAEERSPPFGKGKKYFA